MPGAKQAVWWVLFRGHRVAGACLVSIWQALRVTLLEMATHSSVLAWRIPGAGEPGRRPSMGSHRVRHDWSDLAAAAVAEVHAVCACVRVHACAESCSTLQPYGLNSPPAPLAMGFPSQGCCSVQFSHSVVSDSEDTVVVTISYSRGSSQPRDRNHISWVSYAGKWILYHCATCRAQGSR